MRDVLKLGDFKKIIININQTIQENASYLSELDSTIGDGDHGITIARGFRNAVGKLDETNPKSISELLKATGLTLISTMGGAAGPIFGSIFTEMAKSADGLQAIDLSNLYDMFYSALDKVSKLGGAKPGDKTLIDALFPAVESLKDSVSKGLAIKESLKKMSIAAKKGAASTKDMVSNKGKSRYHGQRSLGYQDAGATTMYLIIKAAYEAI
jgi:dihydroxyacetone kinase-like protein